jgi:hypothetical protein
MLEQRSYWDRRNITGTLCTWGRWLILIRGTLCTWGRWLTLIRGTLCTWGRWLILIRGKLCTWGRWLILIRGMLCTWGRWLILKQFLRDILKRRGIHGFNNKLANLIFCWPCFIVYQYNENKVTHFSFSLLRIKGLYMFRALLAPPEDEKVMLETCRSPWFSINWMKSASSWFHYTEIKWFLIK